jgi:ATP-dependent helicase/nuclease subunit B
MLFKLKNELEKIFETIKNQFKCSIFKPLFIEAKFDSGYKIEAVELKISNVSVKLHGVIDRVDVMNVGGQNFVRVIDYKSGNAKFLNSDLQFGKKIQLFIYMHALIKSGYRPFGLYYFPVKFKFSKDETENEYKLTGQTVDNLELINCADENLKCENISKIFEVKLKDGKTVKSNKIVSEEELLKKCEYSVNLCERAAKEIIDGNIDISPQRGVCEYCEYICVCKNYGFLGERQV